MAKKTLRAPFAGRLGITTLNPGQYLNPGDKVVTLQQLDPILVDFRLPQQSSARIAVGQTVQLTADTCPGVTFDGQASPRSIRWWTPPPATCRWKPRSTITRAGCCRACSRASQVAAGRLVQHLTLPQTAITYNPYGATVFLVAKPADGTGGQTRQTDLRDARGDPR